MTIILSVSFAQKSVSVVEGGSYKQSKRDVFQGVVGYDQTGTYTIRSHGKKIFLEHYNAQMNRSKFVELNLEQMGKKTRYEAIVQTDNKLYLFTSFENKKLNQNFLFSQTINKKTLTVNNDIKKVAQINYEGYSWYRQSNYAFDFSPDSSSFCIYYALPYQKKANEKFGFHVFDEKMNQLWEKKIELPYQDQLFNVEDYKVDNQGNVHILGILYDEVRKEKRRGEPNYKYEILSYYEKGSDFKKYPIQIKGKFLTDMQIAIGTNDNIICAGFYSNIGTFSVIGTYFLKINKNSKRIVVNKFKEFDINFVTQNMTARQEKKAKKKEAKGKNVELYEYDLDDLIIQEDGSVYLVGEQYYVDQHTYTSTNANGGTTTHTTYHYYYNDIIVVYFGSDGNVRWNEKILKKQHTVNDNGYYSSYVLCQKNDQLYFVFNDTQKNLEQKNKNDYSYFTKNKESILVSVEVNTQGIKEKKLIFSIGKYPVLACPKRSNQVSENEIILFGQRKKENKLTKLIFKSSKNQTY